jgi:hypothetical protein
MPDIGALIPRLLHYRHIVLRAAVSGAAAAKLRPRTPLASGRTRSGNSSGNWSSKRRLGHAPGGGVLAFGYLFHGQFLSNYDSLAGNISTLSSSDRLL